MDRNAKLALALALVIPAMVAMAYAAVPLYEVFCRVTGYGGTVTREQDSARPVLDRVIKVRFAANVSRDMPWAFTPVQPSQQVRVGENALAFYEAENRTGRTVHGTATFNVTPFKAGPYFRKIDCFCFTQQTLAPGQRVDMPVTYYIDPAIAEDPALDDVREITLSYTFFRDKGPDA
ncbi:MAG: cytochrome c oxidase assembly protein [Rhodothalassiaceae bacterium]